MPTRDSERDATSFEQAEQYRLQQVDQILEEVEQFKQRAEKEGVNVTVSTRAQLERKLTRR